MIRVFANKQFLFFLITGGIAACVNFFSRILFNHWFSFSSSVILAYLCGMITAFVLAKVFVFKQSSHTLSRSIFYFCAVNLLAVAQTWAISVGLASLLFPTIGFHFYPYEIAHAIGIIVPVFTSYFGHKHWSFADKRK
jgi:putative flippase GtrA